MKISSALGISNLFEGLAENAMKEFYQDDKTHEKVANQKIASKTVVSVCNIKTLNKCKGEIPTKDKPTTPEMVKVKFQSDDKIDFMTDKLESFEAAFTAFTGVDVSELPGKPTNNPPDR